MLAGIFWDNRFAVFAKDRLVNACADRARTNDATIPIGRPQALQRAADRSGVLVEGHS